MVDGKCATSAAGGPLVGVKSMRDLRKMLDISVCGDSVIFAFNVSGMVSMGGGSA